MSQIDSVVSQLQAEYKQLAESLSRIDHALQLLRGSTTRSGRRSLSASARARIAAAQRARWAKVKGRKVVAISAAKKTMSPAARRRIAAAQKTRWAKWRLSRRRKVTRPAVRSVPTIVRRAVKKAR